MKKFFKTTKTNNFNWNLNQEHTQLHVFNCKKLTCKKVCNTMGYSVWQVDCTIKWLKYEKRKRRREWKQFGNNNGE